MWNVMEIGTATRKWSPTVKPMERTWGHNLGSGEIWKESTIKLSDSATYWDFDLHILISLVGAYIKNGKEIIKRSY